jgi:hypothetical protein
MASERAKGAPELELVPDQATQMIREEDPEDRIRDFLEAGNILTVPGWIAHYRNLPVPAYIEPLAELGVLDDLTSATRLGEDGLRYIAKPSGTWAILSVRRHLIRGRFDAGAGHQLPDRQAANREVAGGGAAEVGRSV